MRTWRQLSGTEGESWAASDLDKEQQGYYEDEVEDYGTCLVEASTDTQRYHCENMGVHFGYVLHKRGIPLRFKYYSYRWHYSSAVQMHPKYVIVDGATVATGSYNFSNNAEHQTLENLVFYEAEQYPALVASFVSNFSAIWDTGAGSTYSSLMDQVLGSSASFPIVFDSMALDWQQVSDLKGAIRAECPDINSESFRTAGAILAFTDTVSRTLICVSRGPRGSLLRAARSTKNATFSTRPARTPAIFTGAPARMEPESDSSM